jgi:hypothetical protein
MRSSRPSLICSARLSRGLIIRLCQVGYEEPYNPNTAVLARISGLWSPRLPLTVTFPARGVLRGKATAFSGEDRIIWMAKCRAFPVRPAYQPKQTLFGDSWRFEA